MARTNVASVNTNKTHEGGPAAPSMTPRRDLLRAVSTCMLFENTFYEPGSKIAERIAALCAQVSSADLSAVTTEARQRMHLRHVPLFLARQMAKLHQGPIVGETIAGVIQRPDEISEFLALYWKDGRGASSKLSAQVKRGLRMAFARFGEHALAKWNRDNKVKLRDALFLCHAKPKDEAQAATWKRLIAGELTPPDTWEVALSAGSDKKETFERLIRDKRLGYQALLMNLRNMIDAKVDQGLIRSALADDSTGREKMFPYRFVTASLVAPSLADALSDAMLAALAGHERLTGSTTVLVDVSGSMNDSLSAKAQSTRLQAASSLAVVVREVCATARVMTFSERLVEVSNYRGLPLVTEIAGSQPRSGTYLRSALAAMKSFDPDVHRVIVVTDEQSSDGMLAAWAPKSYIVNVAPYAPGLDTSQGWTRINGWSDRILDWIAMEESVPAGAENPA